MPHDDSTNVDKHLLEVERKEHSRAFVMQKVHAYDSVRTWYIERE